MIQCDYCSHWDQPPAYVSAPWHVWHIQPMLYYYCNKCHVKPKNTANLMFIVSN